MSAKHGDVTEDKLEPVDVAKPPRKPGRLKGRIHMPDEFFDPLPPDVLRAFEGDED